MPVTQNNTIIALHDVSFRYNSTTVLDHINFSIKKGDYVGLLGPNGGGKTTLLKIILGLLKPTSGTVELFGKKVCRCAQRAKIGYVPQRIAQGDLSFPATVREVVESGRTAQIGLFKKFTKKDAKIVDHVLHITGIAHYQNRLIGELSGGERQRVFIARALAGEPEILVLDEPSTGVDVASQETFYAFLKKLNKEYQMTILFVSHDIDVIARESHSVLCLNRVLVCHVSPEEFVEQGHLEKLYGKKTHFLTHHHS